MPKFVVYGGEEVLVEYCAHEVVVEVQAPARNWQGPIFHCGVRKPADRSLLHEIVKVAFTTSPAAECENRGRFVVRI